MELGATYSQFALLRNDKNFVKNFRIKIVIRINTKIGLLQVKRPTSQKCKKNLSTISWVISKMCWILSSTIMTEFIKKYSRPEDFQNLMVTFFVPKFHEDLISRSVVLFIFVKMLTIRQTENSG